MQEGKGREYVRSLSRARSGSCRRLRWCVSDVSEIAVCVDDEARGETGKGEVEGEVRVRRGTETTHPLRLWF
jgi:hypothetical protein